jgi:hypothetical protein
VSVDLERLQADVTDKLNSEELFQYVAVSSFRRLVIASEINASLATLTAKNGKNGTGVLVLMPTVLCDKPNVPGPMVEFGLIVRVFENNIVSSDAVNGSLVTAEAAGLSVMRVLHEWGIYGLTTPYSDKKALTPNYDYEGLIVYDVNFTGELPLAALVSVNVPGLVSPAQTVTLTDTTGGAAVYYTTDGSFPGSGNAAATLYAGPFAVAPGTVVRWAAYKTGMRGSDVGQAVIN